MEQKVIKLPFEISSIDDENAIFKKFISKGGRSPKALKDIKAKLPTTSVQYISDEDFIKLKEIESKLILEIAQKKNKNKFNFFKILKTFLEL